MVIYIHGWKGTEPHYVGNFVINLHEVRFIHEPEPSLNHTLVI